MRGSRLLYQAAARRALRRLSKFGIDEFVASHIAEHFTMVAGKVSHSLFVSSLRSTKAVTGLVTEVLKKGASAPILSATDTGALAWVFEADLGRVIGSAGKASLTKLRVVVDLKGRLITAFPISGFTKTLTVQGIRVTLGGFLAIVALQGIYEDEAAAAMEDRRKFEEANEPEWWEYLNPLGPSATFGYEPDQTKIQERAEDVIRKIEDTTGEKLDSDQRDDVARDVRSIWTATPADE